MMLRDKQLHKFAFDCAHLLNKLALKSLTQSKKKKKILFCSKSQSLIAAISHIHAAGEDCRGRPQSSGGPLIINFYPPA